MTQKSKYWGVLIYPGAPPIPLTLKQVKHHWRRYFDTPFKRDQPFEVGQISGEFWPKKYLEP